MVWTVSLAVLSVIVLSAVSGQGVTDHDQVVACYVSTWAVYRPEKGQFSLDDVNPQLCTHIIYAFVGIDDLTFKIKSIDPQFDITRGGFEKGVYLKKRNSKLKVTVAVGGWIEGSEKYSAMASTPSNRKSFIDSVVIFLQKYGFDGLDLDWEYPANRGGKPQDKDNFVLLTKELKEAFMERGWILTAAMGASKSVIDTAYDLPQLSMYLDFIHLMAYDYHGKWDLITGHNAPLYPRADEQHVQATLNVNYSVSYYLSQGVPADKLVLGLGVYGRTFMLNSTQNPGIGAPAMKSAFSGPYTREDGFLGYNEICEKQTSERGWSIAWQSAHQAPYMFKDKMWVSFDDTNSLGLKVAYAQRLNLAGVMVWSIDTDDFRGHCGQQKFPLLRSINKNMALHKSQRDEAHAMTPEKVPPKETSTQRVVTVRPEQPSVPDQSVDPVKPPSPTGVFTPVTIKPTGRPLPDFPRHEPSEPEVPYYPVHPEEPHDHHEHEVELDEQHPPVHVPTHHDLDKDKPGITVISPDQTNELENSRYQPVNRQETSSGYKSAPTFSLVALVLLFLCIH